MAAALVAGSGMVLAAAASLAQAPPPPPPPPQAPPPPAPPAPANEVRAGRELFQVACSSCHGLEGQGTQSGPPLKGVGAASAHFYLTTGRMPLERSDAQAKRKEPPYTPRQIREMVAYVASLGPGPEIPKVEPERGELHEGNELYANNCASCHGSAGTGGALGHSVYAPSLAEATPTQVAEAARLGPGAMPQFGPDVLDDHQLTSIVRYVEYLHRPENPGGLGLGHLGPLVEGFVSWVVGLGLMVLIIRWIGTRD